MPIKILGDEGSSVVSVNEGGLNGKIEVKRHSRESKVVDTLALILLTAVALLKECNIEHIEICFVVIGLFICALIYKYINIKI